MNRGLAHRSVFEGRSEVRRFLSALTCTVRAGRIELHAYATRFGQLVQECLGRLHGSAN